VRMHRLLSLSRRLLCRLFLGRSLAICLLCGAQVALAEHLTLQGAELAWLLLGGAGRALLLLGLGLGLLGKSGGRGVTRGRLTLGDHGHHLGLLGVLARHLDRLLGSLQVELGELLEGQVELLRHAHEEHAVALGNQGVDSSSEVGHLVLGVLGCVCLKCLFGLRWARDHTNFACALGLRGVWSRTFRSFCLSNPCRCTPWAGQHTNFSCARVETRGLSLTPDTWPP